jgi:xylose isomerase
MRFATRLNSFAARPELFWHALSGKPSSTELLVRAATTRGLAEVDFNFPDHFGASEPPHLVRRAADLGLALNGFAMRYYGDAAFKAGAFTNPQPAVRRRAIDLTKRGLDALAACGGSLMTIWLGQDGWDTPFQVDYARLWADEINALREIAEHNRSLMISIEYKPNEPRAFSVMGNVSTTLLAIEETGASNLGVTLDFAHSLYAGEQPACAAAHIARRSRLLGLHLNDGYGGRDDGLMVGSVHMQQTLELLLQVRRDGYDGAVYFDTFPDASGLDPVAECEANIATIETLLAVVQRLESGDRLGVALSTQDAVTSQRIVQSILLGSNGL